jgi:adenylate kinase family enzyme
MAVLGNTGSGNTSTSRRVSRSLDIPFMELDALFWEADWTPAAEEEFRGRGEAATAGDRWVVDGNYSRVPDVVWPRATTIVWLDYPLRVSVWRLTRGQLGRALRWTELWNGNRESLRMLFASKEFLLLWAVTSYRRRRVEIPEAMAKPEHAHLALHRFRKPSQGAEWEAELRVIAADYPVQSKGRPAGEVNIVREL